MVIGMGIFGALLAGVISWSWQGAAIGGLLGFILGFLLAVYVIVKS